MLNYIKQKNIADLNQDLEHIGFRQVQQYISLYKRFFTLNETNWDKIQLNSQYIIDRVFPPQSNEDGETEEPTINHIHNISIKVPAQTPTQSQSKECSAFLKCIPIHDIYTYLCGEVDINSIKLPEYTRDIEENWNHPNDGYTSYTDGFFYFLSSKLHEVHNFPNAIQYYGTHVAVQDKLCINVFDELDYLQGYDFFMENIGKRFNFVDKSIRLSQTRTNRIALEIDDNETNADILCLNEENVDDLSSKFELLFVDSSSSTVTDTNDASNTIIADIEPVYESNFYQEKNTTNHVSNESNENNDSEEDNDSGDNGEDSNNDDDETSSIFSYDTVGSESEESDDEDSEDEDEEDENEDDDEVLKLEVYNYPVQLLWLENITGITLDKYITDVLFNISDNEMIEKEFASIFMQIIMTLLTYQKTFQMTHNDLHTNNIMCENTDIEYIDYVYNDKTYRVKTYGKIWKIIDFGRAIYKYNGRNLWSSNFNAKGEAKSQFNCPPYYNTSKDLITPTYSFDLCRLGCSLFDFFCEDIDDWRQAEENMLLDETKLTNLYAFICWLCKDGLNKNILYKSLNKERYSGFLLYKMITRKVTHTTPENALETKFIQQYLLNSTEVGDLPEPSQQKIMRFSLDELPEYYKEEE